VESWRFAYQRLLPQRVLEDLSNEARTRFWEGGVANALPRAVTLVAARGDRVIGFCSCGPSLDHESPETRGQVAAIYVDPATSRQGIGRLLMNAARDHLRAQRFTDAELWVMQGNDIGVRFYEGYGWKPSGRTQVETMHGVEITEIGYHLDIDARD
jgi:ribosomal protein S18 acetylase RimI-like enzyme